MENIKKQKIPQKVLKHRAISDSAIEIFLKSGFATASMDEIAKQANVSKRTVYDHFGSKENLFQSILQEHWSLVFTIKESVFGKTPSLTASLQHFAKTFLDFLYQQRTIDLFRLLISESPRFPQLTNSLLRNEKAPFTSELIQFLDSKVKRGELKINNTERAAAYFMGLLKEYHFWPMMLGFTKSSSLKNKNQFIDEVVAIFLKIYAKNSPSDAE